MKQQFFRRVGNTRLYLAPDVSATGVLVLSGEAQSLPAVLDVSQALEIPRSVFLIFEEQLPRSETTRTTVAERLRTFFHAQPDDLRISWIADPTEAIVQTHAVRITAGQGGFELPEQTVVLARNLSLSLPAKAIVRPEVSSLVFDPSPGQRFRFSYDDNRSKSTAALFCSEPISIPLLSESSRAGQWCLGSMSVDQQAARTLGPSIRFFVPSEEPDAPNPIIALVQPVFDASADNRSELFRLYGQIDCGCLTNLDRSFFHLSADAPLPTHLRTATGGSVELIATDDSRLSLEQDSTSLNSSGEYEGSSERDIYFVPAGTFKLKIPGHGSVAMDPPEQESYARKILAGSSGVEYFSLAPAGENQATLLTFVPGKPAYAPVIPLLEPVAAPNPNKFHVSFRQFGELSSIAQTSWVRLSGDTTVTSYFAQPESNVLFTEGTPTDHNTEFLHFKTPIAGHISPDAQPFPIAILAGADESHFADLCGLERQVIAPLRRSLIPLPTIFRAAQSSQLTTTAQGLLLELQGDTWGRLELAQSSRLTPGHQGQLYHTSLYGVRNQLRTALQSSQVFLVISDEKKFLQHCDLSYSLTGKFGELETLDRIKKEIVECLRNALEGSPSVKGEAAFRSLVEGVLSGCGINIDPSTRDTITARAAEFSVTAADWTVNLSPYLWADNGTILLFKFAPQSLQELVANPASWAFPEEFNQSVDGVRERLNRLIEQSRNNPNLLPFYTLATDRNWTGILALSVEAPLTGLPDQLRGLAAGINPDYFQVYYLAIPVTPVVASSGKLEGQVSSVDALLSYEAEDQQATAGHGICDYIVRSLRMFVFNSVMSEFSSTVAFFISELFGDPVAPAPPNSFIPLEGHYQSSSSGAGTYVFLSSTPVRFNFLSSSKILDFAYFDRVQLYTVGQKAIAPLPSRPEMMIHSRFLLSGVLGFQPNLLFDAFSFGSSSSANSTPAGLRVTDLGFDMSFDLMAPTYKNFSVNLSAISTDESASQARPGSLFYGFPLRLTGLQSGSASNRPDKSSFMPLDAPFDSAALGDEWFGLICNLNLGSLGALAQKLDFTARMILAWSPTSAGGGAFFGLSLPGVLAGQKEIPLQGVLKLSFGEVGLVVGGEGVQRSYILQLRNIALQVCGFTIPPGAQIDCLLFGDPSGQNRESAGWYASYLASGASFGTTQTRPLQLESSRLPRALTNVSYD